MSYTRSGNELVSLYRPDVAEARYFHSDGLGSVRGLSGSQGFLTDAYDYIAHGEIFTSQETTPQPYRFAGEPYQVFAEIYYNRARWLSPSQGRFLSRDRYSSPALDPSELHRYVYSSNDPVNRVDPTGYVSSAVSLAIGAAVLTSLGTIGFVGAINARPLRPLSTHLARVDPIIVDGTWSDAEVFVHLVFARRVLREFGVGLMWSGIERYTHRPRPAGEAYTEKDWKILHRQSIRRGKRPVIAFIGKPFIDEGVPHAGVAVHIDSNGPYFTVVSHSHVDSPIWTAHELTHALSDLPDQWGWGNLMELPFPGTKLDDRQVEWLRDHVQHTR